MRMEQWRNNTYRAKPKCWEKNSSKCHFIDHKSHMERRGIETAVRFQRLPSWATAQSLCVYHIVCGYKCVLWWILLSSLLEYFFLLLVLYMVVCMVVCVVFSFFFLWRCDPTRVMASSFMRFLNHTQRRTTVGRTPLDEWSARRRDLYRWDSNPRSQQASGRRPTF